MESVEPVEVFPPGEFINEELEARGWSQVDLAEILGRPVQLVNEIIADRRGITPDTARALAAAFGTSAQYWLNLDAAYQLSKAKAPDFAVGLRALIYSKGPIKEMIRRHWIEPSPNAEVLAERVKEFFELDRIEDEPSFWDHAARKGTAYGVVTPAQRAWLYRARDLARAIRLSNPYSPKALDSAIDQLKSKVSDPTAVAEVPAILSAAGIKFLIVEALPRTRIDGACFWPRETPDTPVVALSLRYDRVDYFWHTLFHELGHVRNGDGRGNRLHAFDTDLVGDHASTMATRPDFERRADSFAVGQLVPQDEFQDFIESTRPLFSRVKVQRFAHGVGVHPGVVIGQLQYRGEILYSHSRDLLVKIRDFLMGYRFVDGWGKVPGGI